MAKKPVGISAETNISVGGQENNALYKSNIKLPLFTDKFQKSFDKCEIRHVFIELVNRFITNPVIDHKIRDIPDYRMSKKDVFCDIALRSKWLVINLRVDNNLLSSEMLKLSENKDKTRPGNRWLEFRVENETQIEEAFRLIDEVCRIND